jgi:hypothetical protein
MRMQKQSLVCIGNFGWILAVLLVLLPVVAVAQQPGAAPPVPPGPEIQREESPVMGYRTLRFESLQPPEAMPAAGANANTDTPASARAIIAQFEQQKLQVRAEMEKRIEQQQIVLRAQLKELAAHLDQTGSLREAQAVRDYLQKFEPAAPIAQADPGTMQNYRDRIGQTFVFEVVGQAGSTIWGDGVYTDDSAIAVAAVHAGIVRVGEHALVQVRIMPGQASYNGTFRNGVRSNTYGPWEGSYSLTPLHKGVVMATPAKVGDNPAKGPAGA